MAFDINKIHAWGDVKNAVYTAQRGVTAPTGPLPTALSAGWYDLGGMSDDGLTESRSLQETKKFLWQNGVLAKTLRSQFENPFKVVAVENNIVVKSLQRPGKAITTTVGTSEVQTVTLTGTGTAGTFSLVLPLSGGIGGVASGITYNATTSVVASALNTAFGATGITVSGTPGTSYEVTFPAAYGNVALMTAVNNITGISAIGVAETTPGVATTYAQGQGGISSNIRQFCIDIVDGTINSRFYIPTAEAAVTGDIKYAGTDWTAYEITITPYADSNGNFYTEFSNDSIFAGTYA